MEKLLYLVHRIPFPPNKGDKIRSFHLLKSLAKQYQIYLGAFVDDDEDWQYSEQLQEYCETCQLVGLNPVKAKAFSLKGMVNGKPLTLPYYESGQMQQWVDQVVAEHNIDKILVFSSAMAQFVEGRRFEHCRRIIDFVDIDSDKWAQYAAAKSWPMSWVYRRESRKLLGYEKRIAEQFDMSLFVSPTEADIFKGLAPESKSKIGFWNNGVDSDYFTPKEIYENPYGEDEQAIVFTGAMDYWANVDAVEWFVEHVFNQLSATYLALRFYIVGSKPTDQVKALEQYPNVVVTGRVPDVRPYLNSAICAVAPMRIARGIQNKVLEAMAMECHVLTSPAGAEGITAEDGSEFWVLETTEQWIAQLKAIIEQSQHNKIPAARLRVVDSYNWEHNLDKVAAMLSPNINGSE